MKQGAFRKIIGKIHLWLGLITGLVVFIVSITGAIYVFEEEINLALQTGVYKRVKKQDTPFLAPFAVKKNPKIFLSGALPT